MKFKDHSEGRYNFHYVCEGCGSEGEIGIPVDVKYKTFGCPEGCGATYILWEPTPGHPALKCVVCPVFEEQP